MPAEDRASERITVRFTPAELDRLVREATGQMTVSELVRARTLGGGRASQPKLRAVFALHVAGMRLKALDEKGAVPTDQAADILDAMRAAIVRLAEDLP
jgi:hypothetical protein